MRKIDKERIKLSLAWCKDLSDTLSESYQEHLLLIIDFVEKSISKKIDKVIVNHWKEGTKERILGDKINEIIEEATSE